MIDFQKEINNQKRKTHSMKVFYSTGNVSHSFANKKYNWQLGYELTHNIGFSLLNEC